MFGSRYRWFGEHRRPRSILRPNAFFVVCRDYSCSLSIQLVWVLRRGKGATVSSLPQSARCSPYRLAVSGCGTGATISLLPGDGGFRHIRWSSSFRLESVLSPEPFGKRSRSNANLSTSKHGAQERYLSDQAPLRMPTSFPLHCDAPFRPSSPIFSEALRP